MRLAPVIEQGPDTSWKLKGHGRGWGSGGECPNAGVWEHALLCPSATLRHYGGRNLSAGPSRLRQQAPQLFLQPDSHSLECASRDSHLSPRVPRSPISSPELSSGLIEMGIFLGPTLKWGHLSPQLTCGSRSMSGWEGRAELQGQSMCPYEEAVSAPVGGTHTFTYCRAGIPHCFLNSQSLKWWVHPKWVSSWQHVWFAAEERSGMQGTQELPTPTPTPSIHSCL